ncbi:nitrogen specific signal transduction histidine kinase NtrB [Desulfitobacterium sp. LBE]|uniref:histidine kinase n=1 Tax=Desulfitobacterium hafniense TaxID=49338 RepID=A0A098B8G6_DESHA|nr:MULTISPECIES: ATP-binding protein [Desulfitobacterium]TWH58170.1 nitrogen specific signal transduction histidine kinase NtrB [Desulfitobacterium sp. LBE]CDX04672.1 Sporulation kinase A [Desulfitobacterium hafniense]
MKKVFLKKSIIQSTLFSITISIFMITMVLMLFFGKTFWEKESVKLEYDLLTIALDVKQTIDSNLHLIPSRQDDVNILPRTQQMVKLDKVVKPLLQEKRPYSVAYYDLEFGWMVSEGKQIESVETILVDLHGASEIKVLNYDYITLVSVPVQLEKGLKGYVWAYATKSEFELGPFTGYSISFSLLFLSIGIIIILIQKFMKEIQHQLEEFSESIVHPETNLSWNSHGLPELEPVLDKIKGYTQELSAINEELGASQRRFTQIMEGISDGLFSIDREWRLLFYNDVAKKYFDKSDEELKMKNILEIFPSFSNTVTYQYIAEVFLTAEPAYFEADGMMTSERIFHTSIYPFEEGITVFFRDITEQRQQQHEMARLERLNLVGQMAAGISHEIRNPLTTVKGFLQLRGIKVTDPDEKEYNDLMISEIDRANTIISEFLSLAKDNMGSTQEQDINQIIYRIFPMIQADANNGNKDLILNLNPLPSLWLNENEIRQLLLNFVRNALEVTPQGGCVIIQTYEDRNNVVLAVKDQGCGIPEEIRDKIGTPFFTTKESGTGLGIAISMGIAHRHNAELTFDTGDQGTTFKVIFKRRNILGKKDEGELS